MTSLSLTAQQGNRCQRWLAGLTAAKVDQQPTDLQTVPFSTNASLVGELQPFGTTSSRPMAEGRVGIRQAVEDSDSDELRHARVLPSYHRQLKHERLERANSQSTGSSTESASDKSDTNNISPNVSFSFDYNGDAEDRQNTSEIPRNSIATLCNQMQELCRSVESTVIAQEAITSDPSSRNTLQATGEESLSVACRTTADNRPTTLSLQSKTFTVSKKDASTKQIQRCSSLPSGTALNQPFLNVSPPKSGREPQASEQSQLSAKDSPQTQSQAQVKGSKAKAARTRLSRLTYAWRSAKPQREHEKLKRVMAKSTEQLYTQPAADAIGKKRIASLPRDLGMTKQTKRHSIDPFRTSAGERSEPANVSRARTLMANYDKLPLQERRSDSAALALLASMERPSRKAVVRTWSCAPDAQRGKADQKNVCTNAEEPSTISPTESSKLKDQTQTSGLVSTVQVPRGTKPPIGHRSLSRHSPTYAKLTEASLRQHNRLQDDLLKLESEPYTVYESDHFLPEHLSSVGKEKDPPRWTKTDHRATSSSFAALQSGSSYALPPTGQWHRMFKEQLPPAITVKPNTLQHSGLARAFTMPMYTGQTQAPLKDRINSADWANTRNRI